MPDSTEARQRRAARNQAMFREVNERLEQLGEQFGANGYQQFVCECAAAECIAPIELTTDEYESTRRAGASFIVAPGHVHADVERVVLEHGRFTVVEKIEAAAEFAHAHNPRTGS